MPTYLTKSLFHYKDFYCVLFTHKLTNRDYYVYQVFGNFNAGVLYTSQGVGNIAFSNHWPFPDNKTVK